MNMTAGTIVYPFRERHLLAMSTPAACLTRIGRVHSDILPASFFRFAGQFAEKFRPRGIRNALGKTMIMGHTVHLQVFHTDDPIAIHKAAAFLVREVVTPERDPLMDASDSFAVLPPFGRTLCKLTVLALHLGKGFFFLTEKAGVGDLFTGGESGKGLEPYVNADLFGAFRQALGFDFARERSVPLAGAALLDGEGFDLALQRAMQDELDMPNARSKELALLVKLKAKLWIREAIITALALEAGMAWVFASFDAAEERLKSQIKPYSDMLQDLGVDGCEGGPFLFQDGIGGMLLVERQALTSLLIGGSALCKQVVIQPTALFKRLIELCFLLFCGVYPVPKHFTHVQIICLNLTGVNRQGTPVPKPPERNAPDIPVTEVRGFTARFGNAYV